jgi:hypothetical protein
MGRYAKLGTMAVRWTAIGFFVLALVFLPFGMAGGGMMGGMMEGQASIGPARVMQQSSAMWWGPFLLNAAMGAVLFALSKPLGSLIATGLDD